MSEQNQVLIDGSFQCQRLDRKDGVHFAVRTHDGYITVKIHKQADPYALTRATITIGGSLIWDGPVLSGEAEDCMEYIKNDRSGVLDKCIDTMRDRGEI